MNDIVDLFLQFLSQLLIAIIPIFIEYWLNRRK